MWAPRATPKCAHRSRGADADYGTTRELRARAAAGGKNVHFWQMASHDGHSIPKVIQAIEGGLSNTASAHGGMTFREIAHVLAAAFGELRSLAKVGKPSPEVSLSSMRIARGGGLPSTKPIMEGADWRGAIDRLGREGAPLARNGTIHAVAIDHSAGFARLLLNQVCSLRALGLPPPMVITPTNESACPKLVGHNISCFELPGVWQLASWGHRRAASLFKLKAYSAVLQAGFHVYAAPSLLTPPPGPCVPHA